MYFEPNAGGCSAATFADRDVTEVKITATFNTTCPEPSDTEGRVQSLITRLEDDSRDGDTGPLCITAAPSAASYMHSISAILVCMLLL